MQTSAIPMPIKRFDMGNVGIFHSPLTSLLSLSLQTVTQCKPRNYLLTSL